MGRWVKLAQVVLGMAQLAASLLAVIWQLWYVGTRKAVAWKRWAPVRHVCRAKLVALLALLANAYVKEPWPRVKGEPDS